MNTTVLELSPQDPLIARDGRPFGAGQGNRMRGLPWPMPSVVAGSLRTALVKAGPALDFSGDMPQRLLQIAVAGVYPVHCSELYLPSPNDCVWDENTGKIHRVQPINLEEGEGVDFPVGELRPVCLTRKQATEDFKAISTPVWWPLSMMANWLTSSRIEYAADWFTNNFFNTPIQSMRDHVCLDVDRGAAEEGKIFASSNLNLTHLPRFCANGSEEGQKIKTFAERFAQVTLSARISIDDASLQQAKFDILHPLGGERRLVHWHHNGNQCLWDCPDTVRQALSDATQIRLVLATPAIFQHGWKPGWLNDQLEGTPPASGAKLKLVGVSNGRWKAVSGWSLAKMNDAGQLDSQGKPGPKPIRRMVPVGSVYFFECERGAAASLADRWLHPLSDNEQERRDGFGLALWGTW